jgi:hypothetical protein
MTVPGQNQLFFAENDDVCELSRTSMGKVSAKRTTDQAAPFL